MLLFQQDSHLLTTKELAGKKKAKGKLSAQIRRKRKLYVGKANNAKKKREKCGSEAVTSPNNQGINTGGFDFSRKKEIVYRKANNSKKRRDIRLKVR